MEHSSTEHNNVFILCATVLKAGVIVLKKFLRLSYAHLNVFQGQKIG